MIDARAPALDGAFGRLSDYLGSMAEERKGANGDGEVLSSLPRTRPHRRSTKRDGAAASGQAAKAKPATRPAARAPGKPKGARPAGSPKAARPAAQAKPARSAAQAKAAPRRGPIVPPGSGRRPPESTGTSGSDVLGTAVQAAGELAQVGLTLGVQVLRRAISRLPRP
jgi:hypothetical protein